MTDTWVVYQMTYLGQRTGRHAVCSQGEWDDMERKRPGHHTLIRDSFTNEGAAEQFARSRHPAPEPASKKKPPARLPDHVPAGVRP